mgnify:CR=1 FL=1
MELCGADRFHGTGGIGGGARAVPAFYGGVCWTGTLHFVVDTLAGGALYRLTNEILTTQSMMMIDDEHNKPDMRNKTR